jgi:predicted metal-dependent hydrolase
LSLAPANLAEYFVTRVEQALFQFVRRIPKQKPGSDCLLDVDGRKVLALVVRNVRARHYRLSIDAQGSIRLVVPRSGTIGEALKFARSKTEWISKVLNSTGEAGRSRASQLLEERNVMFLGEPAPFQIVALSPSRRAVHFGDVRVNFRTAEHDARRILVCALWVHARHVLPGLLAELATLHGCKIGRITVRNQRSRWGSCAANANISLNWRLIQMPAAVADYVMIHELMHTRVMNHSRKFWREVAAACPGFREAEHWLKENRSALLG